MLSGGISNHRALCAVNSKNGNETTDLSLHCVRLDGWAKGIQEKVIRPNRRSKGIQKSELFLPLESTHLQDPGKHVGGASWCRGRGGRRTR